MTLEKDYTERSYLSALEAAKYLNISVQELHRLVRQKHCPVSIASSGQMRFRLKDLQLYENQNNLQPAERQVRIGEENIIQCRETEQIVYVKNSMKMEHLDDDSIHLMITSPPYFNTKMYSRQPQGDDLGNIHDLEKWLDKIGLVWKEVYRVLQPGRKAFINIMNLPVRLEGGSHRTLNLTGKTIDLCEQIGFIFKRDIVWHKTNGVRAHFGSYPYPGGILINHMHEFILEFEKPAPRGFKKYRHLSKEQKENSRLDREFWLKIKNSDVWLMKPHGSGANRNHVSLFPYELPYRLIKAFSFLGEAVLDPFLGSGTTLEAARDLKRNGIGYEINNDIALIALERLQEKDE